MGFLGGSVVKNTESQHYKLKKNMESSKEPTCQCRRYEFDPWLRKIPRRRKWQPTPGFLPGKSRGQKGLVGYSLQSQRSQIGLSY